MLIAVPSMLKHLVEVLYYLSVAMKRLALYWFKVESLKQKMAVAVMVRWKLVCCTCGRRLIAAMWSRRSDEHPFSRFNLLTASALMKCPDRHLLPVTGLSPFGWSTPDDYGLRNSLNTCTRAPSRLPHYSEKRPTANGRIPPRTCATAARSWTRICVSSTLAFLFR